MLKVAPAMKLESVLLIWRRPRTSFERKASRQSGIIGDRASQCTSDLLLFQFVEQPALVAIDRDFKWRVDGTVVFGRDQQLAAQGLVQHAERDRVIAGDNPVAR